MKTQRYFFQYGVTRRLTSSSSKEESEEAGEGGTSKPRSAAKIGPGIREKKMQEQQHLVWRRGYIVRSQLEENDLPDKASGLET